MGDGLQDDGLREKAGAERGRGEKVADWADGRLGLYSLMRGKARKAFPDHWSFLLGEISLYSFVVVIITGVYLTLFFHPSMNQVEYHGSYAPLRGQLVSEAFDSTMHISFDVRGGLLIRQAHHWAALVFVGALLMHMMRVFFTGAFRKPRELNWVLGFLLLVLAMFAGLTGYDLPDDLLSGTGLAVVNGTILSLPIVGTYLSMFLFGGEFPGTDLVARFNTIHVLIIPALMVGLLLAHLFLAPAHRHTQYPGRGRTERNVVGLPLKVRAVKSTGFFFLVADVIFTLAAVAQINPVWRYGPYRADQVSAGSQPDWYMGVADGLLRVMPGWELTFWGHTLALDNLIPLLAGVGVFVAMGVYPFLEAWVTGDTREHHLLDRPRNRPVRTALGVSWISFYLVALIGAANDIIATRLHVAVESVTWAVRIGLVVVPPLVYVLTRRWALGLQRQDRDKVLHGRETGIIKRMPNGEFVEVHEPLGQEELALLTQRDTFKPIAPGTAVDGSGSPADGGGPDGGFRPVRRLRAALNRTFYGDEVPLDEPPAREHQEIAGGPTPPAGA